jgi:hypothetical protein
MKRTAIDDGGSGDEYEMKREINLRKREEEKEGGRGEERRGEGGHFNFVKDFFVACP